MLWSAVVPKNLVQNSPSPFTPPFPLAPLALNSDSPHIPYSPCSLLLLPQSCCSPYPCSPPHPLTSLCPLTFPAPHSSSLLLNLPPPHPFTLLTPLWVVMRTQNSMPSCPHSHPSPLLSNPLPRTPLSRAPLAPLAPLVP